MKNTNSTSQSTSFATTAIACFAYSAVALLMLHGLRPEYANLHRGSLSLDVHHFDPVARGHKRLRA